MTPIIRPKDALLAVSFLEAAVASRGPLTDARRSTIQYGEYARNQRNTRGQNRQYPLAPVARNLKFASPANLGRRR
jgi:hypothetical protein